MHVGVRASELTQKWWSRFHILHVAVLSFCNKVWIRCCWS